jgi:transposase
MIDLVRAGRTPEELSWEFEPSAASIIGWVRLGDAEDGMRPDAMTSAEREEIARLRRKNRDLHRERDISAEGEPSKAPPVRARWRTPGSRRRRTGVRPDAIEPRPCIRSAL